MISDRFSILDQAKTAVTERQTSYGSPEDNASLIAGGWSLILGENVSVQKVALCLAWLKIARLCHDLTSVDSWVDLAGYAAYGGEVACGESDA